MCRNRFLCVAAENTYMWRWIFYRHSTRCLVCSDILLVWMQSQSTSSLNLNPSHAWHIRWNKWFTLHFYADNRYSCCCWFVFITLLWKPFASRWDSNIFNGQKHKNMLRVTSIRFYDGYEYFNDYLWMTYSRRNAPFATMKPFFLSC